MSRPLRLHAPNLTFHVMSRGNARMPIYRDATDHERFLEILGDAVERWSLRCWAFCLMPNHYHLVVRTADDTLSPAMRHVNGVYAQWWNRRHQRVGHVTQGRFKAQVVQEHRYLVAVCRYVLLNPVRAGLVADPAAWPWSSCAATLGLTEPPPFLSSTLLLDLCTTGSLDRRRAALRRLLNGPDALDVARSIREDTRVIGDDAFAERFLAEAARAPRAVSRRERLLGRPPLMRLLLRRTPGSVAARVRTALHAGYGVADIAEALGVTPADVRRLASTRRGDGPAGRRHEMQKMRRSDGET